MTNAELAVLSLLTEQARHGYEIESLIEQRGMREWTEVGFSSIYYILKKLESAGLVSGQLEEAPRGPARKVFSITPTGMTALHEAVLQALSTPHNSYPPIQLGLANLPLLTREEAITALMQHRDSLLNVRENLRANQQAQQPLPYFVDAMFDYSLTMTNAQIVWIETFIQRLKSPDDLLREESS